MGEGPKARNLVQDGSSQIARPNLSRTTLTYLLLEAPISVSWAPACNPELKNAGFFGYTVELQGFSLSGIGFSPGVFPSSAAHMGAEGSVCGDLGRGLIREFAASYDRPPTSWRVVKTRPR